MNRHQEGWSAGLYRSRTGAIFGVCKGLSNHFGFSLFWLRILTIVLAFVTGLWPCVLAYILLALTMKPEPVVQFHEDMDREFYDSYVNSRYMALTRLKNTFDNLDRRIGRMEGIVTARDWDWERRLNG